MHALVARGPKHLDFADVADPVSCYSTAHAPYERYICKCTAAWGQRPFVAVPFDGGVRAPHIKGAKTIVKPGSAERSTLTRRCNNQRQGTCARSGLSRDSAAGSVVGGGAATKLWVKCVVCSRSAGWGEMYRSTVIYILSSRAHAHQAGSSGVVRFDEPD